MANTEIRDGIIWIIEAEGEWPLGPAPTSIKMVETVEEKFARLENQNLTLMDTLATTLNELLALKALVEGGAS